MKKIFVYALLSLLCLNVSAQSLNVDKQLKYCNSQVKKALKHLAAKGPDYTMEARNILLGETEWNCRKARTDEWCSGFWPGVLWMDYDASGKLKVENGKLLAAAKAYTQPIIDDIISQPVFDHDLGFITINSLIKGYEVTKSEEYRSQILKAANELTKLYNPRVGTILSWPRHIKDFGGHNTIMDNMINTELLYWASEHGGSKELAEIAKKHAETTMKNHFRPDGSCYHVAVYDTISGKLKYCKTHQGYADYSMWSRGQAWAIYGYTMTYRYTKDQQFLDFAQKVTDIYLKRLHETSDDWVPLWDMDARPDAQDAAHPSTADGSYNGIVKDASTAATIASALLELSQYVTGTKSAEYKRAAIGMLTDLSTARYQSRSQNDAFLMHSVGNHPAGSEIDCSIVYADYYYIEALLRLKAM